MAISLAPTFLNIVLLLTWLIDLLLIYGVYARGKKVIGFRRMLHMHRPDLLDQLELAKAKAGLTVIHRDWYLLERKVFFFKFLPANAVVAALTRLAQIWLPRMQPSAVRVLLGTLVVSLAALLLYQLKQRNQVLYGCFEFMFAAMSLAYSLMKMGDTFTGTGIIVLFSSIYLMIRAMDNFERGLEKNREKEQSILATIARLSPQALAMGQRTMFAATVRATGELFFVSTGTRGNQRFTAHPPIDGTADYDGVLFTNVDAGDLKVTLNPQCEARKFNGKELREIGDSMEVVQRNWMPRTQRT